MSRRLSLFSVAALLLAVTLAAAQAPAPTLSTAHGAVAKVAKDSLTIRPRSAEGRFEKELTLQITGTSRVTLVTMQKRAGKDVPVQNETDIKDLKPQQPIAVVYTTGASGPVLLTAVVLAAP